MFAILRTKKINSIRKITAMIKHNLRLGFANNVNRLESVKNQVLINTLNADTSKATDFTRKLDDFYKSKKIKIKKENVLAMEFVLTASPEYFKNGGNLDKWVETQKEFIKNEFGDQVKFAVLHLDETSPHIHVITSNDITSVKNYKNQKGSFSKETTSLSAKKYSPFYLRELQTRYAKANKHLGLERGIKGSTRKHLAQKEYYKIIDRANSANYLNAIDRKLDSLKIGLFSSKENILKELKNEFAPLLNALMKQQKVVSELLKFDKREYKKIKEERKKLKNETAEIAKKWTDLEEKKRNIKSYMNRNNITEENLTEIIEIKNKNHIAPEEKQELASRRKLRM